MIPEIRYKSLHILASVPGLSLGPYHTAERIQASTKIARPLIAEIGKVSLRTSKSSHDYEQSPQQQKRSPLMPTKNIANHHLHLSQFSELKVLSSKKE